MLQTSPLPSCIVGMISYVCSCWVRCVGPSASSELLSISVSAMCLSCCCSCSPNSNLRRGVSVIPGAIPASWRMVLACCLFGAINKASSTCVARWPRNSAGGGEGPGYWTAGCCCDVSVLEACVCSNDRTKLGPVSEPLASAVLCCWFSRRISCIKAIPCRL